MLVPSHLMTSSDLCWHQVLHRFAGRQNRHIQKIKIKFLTKASVYFSSWFKKVETVMWEKHGGVPGDWDTLPLDGLRLVRREFELSSPLSSSSFPPLSLHNFIYMKCSELDKLDKNCSSYVQGGWGDLCYTRGCVCEDSLQWEWSVILHKKHWIVCLSKANHLLTVFISTICQKNLEPEENKYQ